jgi:hypothetical protein
MRHHWGLGVGHSYSHQDAPTSLITPQSSSRIAPSGEASVPDPNQASGSSPREPGGSTDDPEGDGDTDSENSEFCLSDKEGVVLDVESEAESETEIGEVQLEAVKELEPPQPDSHHDPARDVVPEVVGPTLCRDRSSESDGGPALLTPEPVAPTVRRSTRPRAPRRMWQPA